MTLPNDGILNTTKMKSKQTGIYESTHVAKTIILWILMSTCLTIRKRATNTIAMWY